MALCRSQTAENDRNIGIGNRVENSKIIIILDCISNCCYYLPELSAKLLPI